MKTCKHCGADAASVVLMFESPLERDLVCVDQAACRLRAATRATNCKHCGADNATSLLFPAAIVNDAIVEVECWNRSTCRMRVIERAFLAQPLGKLILCTFDGGANALLLASGETTTTLVCAPRPA